MSTSLKSLLLATAGSALLLSPIAGCANADPSTLDCGDGTSVTVGEKSYCVHRSAIIETGFNCPPEAQFAFPQEAPSGEPMTVCSPDEETPKEVLEEVAMEAEENPGDGSNNPPSNPPTTPPPTTCTDEDGDGVCAENDCDDRDASIWENCPEVPVCTDEDGDGVCVEPGEGGGDCDDTDPEIKPGIVDYCDQVDNNCDGVVDENGCAETCDPGACTTTDDCADGQACREVADGCYYCF